MGSAVPRDKFELVDLAQLSPAALLGIAEQAMAQEPPDTELAILVAGIALGRQVFPRSQDDWNAYLDVVAQVIPLASKQG